MKEEHWIDRLSEYMDGELDAAERAACSEHVSRCERCAETLAELRAVASEAALLPDLPPERDLWPEIAERLPPREALGSPAVVSLASRRRRVAFTVPQLVAAAIALVVLSAGSVWLILPALAGPGDGVAASEALAGAAAPAPAGARPIFATAYDQAVLELEAEFDRRRDRLDPETIRVVERNLAIIDRAIVEASQALAEDPASTFLNAHLANAMRRKVDLLRRVAEIEQTEI
jgi:anti-sigma factor RsiW